MNRNLLIKIALSAVLVTLPVLSGCKTGRDIPYSKNGLYFDTVVSVEIYGPKGDPESILDECMNICAHYEELFDKNSPTGDIAMINSHGAGTFPVDHDTAVLLSEALDYSAVSRDKFDITIAPVSALWDFHEENGHIPSDDDIHEALKCVDHNNIEADPVNNTVTVKDPNLSVDIGAAAKGYIADSIANYLKAQNIDGAIINMGGDMRLVGRKTDGSGFNIGINDPSNPGNCILSLYLSDISVATSGTYERSFTIDGTEYHHILDVNTGYPAVTDVRSVTVITRSATDADCLCTIAILSGSAEALKLIESLKDTEAVFILTDGSIVKSSGADSYIRKQ